jgi:hypothetical protein
MGAEVCVCVCVWEETNPERNYQATHYSPSGFAGTADAAMWACSNHKP